mmetsp:Transcript_4589/g.11234  ORF Transcript_4589/g.11234 Transcript_4589/m.11234 type:complete len:271 (-) Transcript_4589:2661-3473(-)
MVSQAISSARSSAPSGRSPVRKSPNSSPTSIDVDSSTGSPVTGSSRSSVAGAACDAAAGAWRLLDLLGFLRPSLHFCSVCSLFSFADSFFSFAAAVGLAEALSAFLARELELELDDEVESAAAGDRPSPSAEVEVDVEVGLAEVAGPLAALAWADGPSPVSSSKRERRRSSTSGAGTASLSSVVASGCSFTTSTGTLYCSFQVPKSAVRGFKMNSSGLVVLKSQRIRGILKVVGSPWTAVQTHGSWIGTMCDLAPRTRDSTSTSVESTRR